MRYVDICAHFFFEASGQKEEECLSSTFAYGLKTKILTVPTGVKTVVRQRTLRFISIALAHGRGYQVVSLHKKFPHITIPSPMVHAGFLGASRGLLDLHQWGNY